MKMMLLINLMVLFALSGCKKESSCEESIEPTCCVEKKEEHHPVKRNEGPSDLSIYNLSSEWIKQDGEKVMLESFQGKPQLITFIYTSCSYACPRIITDLKRIDQKLSEKNIENYGIILVTMDPEKDTPEILRKFAGENKMNSEKWKLLTGNPENIRELSILLNVKYKKTDADNISHSNSISVLNKKGEVVYQVEGLGGDCEGTVKALEKLLKE